MKGEFIEPCIQSVVETFDRMLACKVRSGEPFPTENESNSQDLIGIIGFSGTTQGMIALKFPVDAALTFIGDLVACKFTEINPAIVDGVGELLNIIAGNAKVKLKGHKISISLPTVLRGGIHLLTSLSIEYITIPFESDRGNFELVMGLKPVMIERKEQAHESAHS
jgi:chemotaxis protein CheX